MMEILTFNFTTPLHIGTVKAEMDTSESILHSDSLYAAIVHAWAQLGVNLYDIVDEGGGPKFALSSMFPFCTVEGKEIYFLPVPKGVLKPDLADTNTGQKDIDKVQYMDMDWFRQLQPAGSLKIKKSDIKGKYLTAVEGFDERFMSREVYPRVKVPRDQEREDPSPYYLERIFFQQGAGFYCLAIWDTPSVKQNVLAALRYLGDEGLGTDRHVGNGMFEVKESKSGAGFLLSNDSAYKTNVSLFCPPKPSVLQDMLGGQAAYDLPIKRGGWMSRENYLSYRKKAVFMFREGGIFKTNETVVGQTVNLAPERTPRQLPEGESVWRCGKSIFLPIHRKTEP
ncbi:MAG: type III-A CRISPR-associated RAMP protein Csm4 [Lewinellaceae bacterium]|nr:type III-A CRISPR-associated RAMP protein Csm4 [Saprospiraceae bacterium]MCB9338549.1 type III-A CRISPR-associated RAMP protein Csm4 [Lewinellaceae bacterium]